MPTRLPDESTSAPPEFPGLIAASVWMKFSKVLMPKCVRPSALTIPAVTVCPTPNGLPIAKTQSPTFKLSGCANVMAGKPLASMRNTARSVSGSDPITRAGSVLPSDNAI